MKYKKSIVTKKGIVAYYDCDGVELMVVFRNEIGVTIPKYIPIS